MIHATCQCVLSVSLRTQIIAAQKFGLNQIDIYISPIVTPSESLVIVN